MAEYNKHIHEFMVIYGVKYEGTYYRIFEEQEDAIKFIEERLCQDH